MKKLVSLLIVMFAAVVVTTATATPSTPFDLKYSVGQIDSQGQYPYDFTLWCNGCDGSQKVMWLVFGSTNSQNNDGQWGDNGYGYPDFSLTSAVPLPWLVYSASGGGPSGPSFGPPLNAWQPNPGDPDITWSGTSPVDLRGVLMWTYLTQDAQGNYVWMSQPGTQATPEPGTLIMFGSGILGLAGVLRRKINL
jgi:hypothetical protein